MSGTADTPARLDRGVLVLVVGASGTGKDTLLRLAQERLAGNAAFVFPRRRITRPSDASEPHMPVTDEQFRSILAANGFALSWDAHGLRYGIERTIDDDLRAGRCVVCNVSRTIIGDVRRSYGTVVVLEISASDAMRKARILNRGREAPADVAERLERRIAAADDNPSDACIENNGTLAEACDRFVDALARAAALRAQP